MLELEDMVVMTARHARSIGYLLRDDVAALGILYREGADTLAVQYPTIERVRDFIKDFNPTTVTLESHINEDCTEIREVLKEFLIYSQH